MCRGESILSILKFLLGINSSLEQIGFSIEILLFLDEIRIRVGNGRLGRFQGRLVIGRIDFKQKITGLDLLIVVDRNVDDRAGDARRNTNDIGSDLAIAGPGSVTYFRYRNQAAPAAMATTD
jgi:hypothetical protein